MRRRWTDLPLRVKALLVLSVPILPLLAATFGVLDSAHRENEAERWVEHTLQVKAQLEAVLQIMASGDAATNDFLSTRSRAARDRYDEFMSRWPAAAERLESLVADNPAQVAHLRELDPFRGARPFGTLIDYADNHPPGEPLPAALVQRSRAVLDAERAVLLEMQDVEDALLSERVRSVRDAHLRLLLVASIGALVGVLGGGGAALAFSRGITARIDAVRENSQRLVNGESLRTLPAARDEIGQLSAQLHRAWELLTERVAQADRSRAELDHFFSVSIDLLCIAGVDGTFKRVNPAWEEVLGWTSEELTSLPYVRLLHPDDVEMTATTARHQAYHDSVMTLENRYRCKDGTYRWLSWRSVSVPGMGLIFAAARDITEQKRIDEELRTKITELGEVNAELESFTYSVSHDLRAPLRHITGFAQLLERSASGKLNDQERRWLGLTSEAGTRMGRLIDDLLAFCRIGRATLASQRVSLDAVVRDAIEEVRPVENGRDVSWHVAPLPEVKGDPALLRLVFVNLLSNALKYSRERDHARVEVGRADDGSEAVVYVRDNGVGFDMKYVDKLFGVFQRLHDADRFEGTGIGLANVRRIITRHGGRVWAEAVVDRGATFYVSLPLAQRGVA